MQASEAIAVIILIVAVLILIYYFLINNPNISSKIKSYVPATADPHMDQILHRDGTSDYNELSTVEDEIEKEKEGMGKKIKVRLSDIDMSGFNTDAFSKKIDAFLDEKSDQLIQDWSLATLNDLESLEKKFENTAKSVDELDSKFKKFKKDSKKFQDETRSKLDEIDERIKALEK